jgi:hypothetical protein
MLAHITAIITMVRGCRAFYRWCLHALSRYTARHSRATGIELDGLAARMRGDYWEEQGRRRTLLEWMVEIEVQPEDLV